MDAKRMQIELAKQKRQFEIILKEKIKDIVPEVYSCFAKALYDRGWDGDAIEELFMETQDLWTQNADSMQQMIDWVAETTGIEVRGEEYIGE